MKELSDNGELSRPDFISYSTVMNVWAKQGHPERANSVLRAMYDDYLAGNETAKPDLQCFNVVLTAYINSKDDDAANQALSFLNHMKKITEDGILDVRPDVYTMSSGEFICGYHSLWRSAEQVLILTFFSTSHISVLACLANTKHNRQIAAGKAEHILIEMRESFKAGDRRMRPNSFCYNNVMDAWARSDNPKRAESVFLQMCEDFRDGNEAAKLQTTTFNSTLFFMVFNWRY